LSSLREKLKALEELQAIDLEMNGVRGEADALPARRAALDTAVAEARKAWQSERERLEGNERERRQVESLLAMERDKVKKWEGRLGEIKTPREYAALSREIDIAKKANETQNEQLKVLGAAAEEIRKAVESRGDTLSERELTASDEVANLEKRAQELANRMAELEARRADAAKRVEPTLLGKYENIKRRRAGIAVAPVVAGSCRGCNRNIPPQLSIVLHRVDSIETCPNCNRIIYSADAVNPPAPSPA
jgi:hypothetical protein